jgi:hypothetical protein
MSIIPKSVGTILILGALAGCAGDDGATPDTSTPPTPGQSPTGTPGVRPAMKTDPAPKLGGGKMEAAKPGTDPAPTADKKTDDAPKIEGPTKAESPKPSGAAAKLSDDDLKGIKELSAKAEQDAAIAQAVCPVSTHNLGSMGKPLKVTAEGRTFYICCDSCEDKVKTDGKAVVAKLDKLTGGK